MFAEVPSPHTPVQWVLVVFMAVAAGGFLWNLFAFAWLSMQTQALQRLRERLHGLR